MDYKNYETPSYRLHVIKTKRYKNIYVKINFKRKAKKEELTKRCMLAKVLSRATKNYPTIRLMTKRCEELYGLRYDSNAYLSGNYSIITFEINALNDNYSEEGNFAAALDFLMGLIFNPDLQNNAFNATNFNLEKEALEDEIKGIKDNHRLYSNKRLLELIDENMPFSYHSEGYLEDLNNLDAKMLYDYYKDVLKYDIVDIFVLGDVDFDFIKNFFAVNFPIKTVKRKSASHYLTHHKLRRRFKAIKETNDKKQSDLLMAYKTAKLTDFESKYVSNVYSFILGGGPDSKLFQNVREKNSLCYTISSSLDKLDNLLIIGAGIDKANYKKTVSLIKKEVKNMALGKFSLNDIENAKITYINGLREMTDSSYLVLNNYISMYYLNLDTIEERIKMISKVDKDMVVNFAKKLHPDTIFFLEGGDSDEAR